MLFVSWICLVVAGPYIDANINPNLILPAVFFWFEFIAMARLNKKALTFFYRVNKQTLIK